MKNKIVVSTYDKLIKELKLLNIGAQEAFDLAYKNKYQFNSRYYWAMNRIGMYLRRRIISYIKTNFNLRKKYSGSKDILDKKMHSLPSNIFGLYLRKETLEMMPSKISGCKETVDSPVFKNEFKKFNPKKKFDPRLETQNLHKLICKTDKKFNKKYFTESNNMYFDIHGKEHKYPAFIPQNQIDLVR